MLLLPLGDPVQSTDHGGAIGEAIGADLVRDARGEDLLGAAAADLKQDFEGCAVDEGAGKRLQLLRARTKTGFRQKPLFCTCGERLPAIAGLCSRCYRARRHSRDCFGGNREIVLARDRYRCASCGEASLLHVHHRHPGNSDPDLLITVCCGCHARLHRLASIHVWIPELLATFWAEQHPTTPVQLQFAFGAEA